MAGISSTSFMLILFGVLLLNGSVQTLARMPIENNIIKEVIAEQEAANISPLENVEIIMKPKANAQILGCVGYMQQCGPLYPCCGSYTCTMILAKFGFYCYA